MLDGRISPTKMVLKLVTLLCLSTIGLVSCDNGLSAHASAHVSNPNMQIFNNHPGVEYFRVPNYRKAAPVPSAYAVQPAQPQPQLPPPQPQPQPQPQQQPQPQPQPQHVVHNLVPAQMEGLLKQIQSMNHKSPINVNNQVSKVKIGNTKETNINNINHSVAPIVQKSQTSQDVGPKNTQHINVAPNYQPHQMSPIANAAAAAYVPVMPPSLNNLMPNQVNQFMSNNGKKPKKQATEEQKELKNRLLDLASKATSNPSLSEPILKYNQRTGTLEKVAVDPNADLYKDKLHQAIAALNPKKLPADKLRRVLNDDDEADHNPEATIYLNQDELQPELEPEQEVEPVPEEEAPVDPNSREYLVDQVRAELDDRLNRISDLLYFRPEFMNQLLQIDDPSELTPVESEFKRMILCNSDEEFCLKNIYYPVDETALNEEPAEEEQWDEAPAPSVEPEAIQEDVDDEITSASAGGPVPTYMRRSSKKAAVANHSSYSAQRPAAPAPNQHPRPAAVRSSQPQKPSYQQMRPQPAPQVRQQAAPQVRSQPTPQVKQPQIVMVPATSQQKPVSRPRSRPVDSRNVMPTY